MALAVRVTVPVRALAVIVGRVSSKNGQTQNDWLDPVNVKRSRKLPARDLNTITSYQPLRKF